MTQKNEDVDWTDVDLDDDEDTQKDKYLTFRIADDGYGIEILYVTEIIGVQKITEVPNTPDYVLGIINLRGTVIPVMDVRLRLSMDQKDFDDLTCIIVVNMEDTIVGLLVDEVQDVSEIPESQMEPPPRVSKGEASRFMQGIGKTGDEVKLILNVQKLLYDEKEEQDSEAA